LTELRTAAQNLCLHNLIEVQSETTPDAVALIAGNDQVTYAQLNASANQLARFLRAKGVRPEVLVALCVKRSVEMLVAMLGVLKAGGAYIPLNPMDPAERKSFQLRDSGTTFLLTTDDLADTLPVDERTLICLDADWPEIARESRSNLAPAAELAHPAYVIYTSGSTGAPKGVVVTHSGLLNYLLWAVGAYGKEARRSSLVHSAISFDLTITGLYTPLLVGGQVELLPEETGAEALVVALRKPETRGLVKITPAHLEFLSQRLRPEEAAGKVELFVIGGENLTAKSLRFWREVSPTTRLINEYGPTETVVGCCVYEVQAADPFTGSVPIGKAIDRTKLYILDPQQKPVSTGLAGELYIGGAGVARGYLNRPELTGECFLADPFSNEPGARMYKTGDMVSCGSDGNLQYQGRLDDQVKIRGYRVELGEVETAVTAHSAVRQCAAIAREDQPGSKQLVAYLTPQPGQMVAPKELREFLRQKLPEYMVPAHFVFLDAFPLTPNGKVDRRALPVPEKTSYREEFIAPENDIELRLAAIWEKLFDIPLVGVTDSFFDLGGDSLLVARFLVEVEESFAKELSMATLFEAPTIRELAVILESQAPSKPGVIPVQPKGFRRPFFCVGAGPLFRPLALRLGTDRPFLSLMPSHLEIKQLSAPYRLDQIAAHLLNTILDYQKEGPYYLGGWSASGVVAYETARQLIEKGHQVALLVMFDTANPTGPQSERQGWLESCVEMITFLASEVSKVRLRTAPAYFAEKVKELRRKFDKAALRARQTIPGPLKRRGSENPDQIVQLAVSSYRPGRYGGDVVFFQAAERPSNDVRDFNRGWQGLVSGRFDVYEVPGDHRSMFHEPNVETLAKNMSNSFSRKEPSEPNPGPANFED
jgi:amino acid adenylation domain-containing protein